MTNSLLSALREAATALRAGGSDGQKVKLGSKEVKRARKALGLTQQEFAQKVGVSVQTVRTWEQGISVPGLLSTIMLTGFLAEAEEKRETEDVV